MNTTVNMRYLTFIKNVGKNKFGKTMGLYKCKCGNEKEICNSSVKSGHTKSCGCLQTIQNPEKYKNKTFSYLTFIEYKGKDEKGAHLAKFRCDCGVEKIYVIYTVLKGQNKSCGCFKKNQLGERSVTHGLTKHPLYKIWGGIIDRCYNINNDRYGDYGGRGVVMCEEWRGNFKSFYDWCVSNGWCNGLQIDKDIKARKLGIGPLLYSPEMCSIVTPKQNVNATRRNVELTYNAQKRTVTQWAEVMGVHPRLIYKRIERKWPIEKILTTPSGIKPITYEVRYSFGYIN